MILFVLGLKCSQYLIYFRRGLTIFSRSGRVFCSDGDSQPCTKAKPVQQYSIFFRGQASDNIPIPNQSYEQKASALILSWWLPRALIRCHAKTPDLDFTLNPDSASNLVNHATAH